MSDKGAQSEELESSHTPDLGNSEAFAKIEDEIAKMLAHCPNDPVERLFWHEHWLRVAAKRFATQENQPNRCLLRQMAILYSAIAAGMGSKS